MKSSKTLRCCCLVLGLSAFSACPAIPDALVPDGGQLAPDGGQLAPDGGQLAPDGGQIAPDGGQIADSACPALEGTGANPPRLHGGTLAAPDVWRASESPHVVTSDLFVFGGGRITVEPCAVVRLAEEVDIELDASPGESAEFVALGEADRPILIEGQGGARWGRIVARTPATIRLAHVVVQGGGGGTALAGESLAVEGNQVLPPKPLLFVDGITVRDSAGAGVKVSGGATFIPGSRGLTITASGSTQHPFPLEVGELAMGTVPSGTYTGNATDALLIAPEVVSAAEGLQTNATLKALGVPWRVGRLPQGSNLLIGSGGDGAFNPTLTLEAGVTLQFEPGNGLTITRNDVGVSVLEAVGTPEKPVVFTSARGQPAPGDWRGLWFQGKASAQNRLEHVRIEYTGSDCNCWFNTCTEGVTSSESAIILEEKPAGIFLRDSVIAHASGHGVVQGWDGASLDWQSSNAYEDVQGCRQTEPRQEDTDCPDPRPACL